MTNPALRAYLSLCEQYLGGYQNVNSMIDFLNRNPYMFTIYCGELDAALMMFSVFQQSPNTFSERAEVLVNSSFLVNLLSGDSLPPWQVIDSKLKSYIKGKNSSLWKTVFGELAKFEFLAWMDEPRKISGAFFIAVYRTYVLTTMKNIRKGNGQVASSVEEMLATMALQKCPTQLFNSIKHWILDYKTEGFSAALAEKVQLMGN